MRRMMGAVLSMFLIGFGVFAAEVPQRVLELRPGPGNPRNSEGSFVTLKDGGILFIYTRFNGSEAENDDDCPADLCARVSHDGGRTWSGDRVVLSNRDRREAQQNMMSVSLLRLADDRIALFYLRKNGDKDCRPVLRTSTDEGVTWSAPTDCIADADKAYYVLNNDRAVQLKDGRIVLPLACYAYDPARIRCCCSDDAGKSWHLTPLAPPLRDAWKNRQEEEPGVIELKDGRLMMFIRNQLGAIAFSYSSDRGETWSDPVLSGLQAPLSPTSIKRLPNGDLVIAWNDQEPLPDSLKRYCRSWDCGPRIPLTLAISKDEGKTWIYRKILEGNPNGWYCYTAILPVGNQVFFGYCAMDNLSHSRITRVPVAWLYTDASPAKSVFAPVFTVDKPISGDEGNVVTNLASRIGIWEATPGKAELRQGRFGVPVMMIDPGEQEGTVTLTVPRPATLNALGLFAERVTSHAPFRFAVEMEIGGQWKEVWHWHAIPAWDIGRLWPIEATGPDAALRATRFRFRCGKDAAASRGSAALIHGPLPILNGFFND